MRACHRAYAEWMPVVNDDLILDVIENSVLIVRVPGLELVTLVMPEMLDHKFMIDAEDEFASAAVRRETNSSRLRLTGSAKGQAAGMAGNGLARKHRGRCNAIQRRADSIEIGVNRRLR